MLKYIIIARHGLCDRSSTNRALTPKGAEQIKALAATLEPFLLPCAPLAIYTSPAQRVAESAEIFGSVYGVRPIEFSSLFLTQPDIDIKNVFDLVAGLDNIDAVVLFSHHDLIPRLAARFCFSFCNFNYIFPQPWEGEAYIFQLQEKNALKAFYYPGSNELRIANVFH